MNELPDARETPPEMPHRVVSEHVRRASGRATTVVLVVIVLFLYGIRPILLPFVLAGAAAYACTPVVNSLTARTRLPRVVWAIAVFCVLAGMLALVARLGLPALFTELANFATDTERMLQDAIRGGIGDRTVLLLGQPMDAAQLA